MRQLMDIGFPGKDDPNHVPALNQAIQQGETIPAPHGKYVVWKSQTGAQVWFEFDQDDKYLGCLPYFSGNACMDVGIQSWSPYSEDNQLDGAAEGWAGAHEFFENEDGSVIPFGDYPIVFNLPDFALWSHHQVPLLAHARITGFAAKCTSVVDEESLDQLHSLGDFPMAAEAFFPSQNRDSLNLISGRILDAALLTNELTGQTFYWAWVRTYGGELDLVIHPDNLTGELLPDGFLQADVWLCGQIVQIQE